MRLLAFLLLGGVLLSASPVEARLFWQTYGSTTPSGAGNSWNWNQDYFVPRYPSSNRYGMFSSCKTSRTTSAACRGPHPFYPGYCDIYGPSHYQWRNHVYRSYCGSTPVPAPVGPWRTGRGNEYGAARQAQGCRAAVCGPGCFEHSALATLGTTLGTTSGYLPHVFPNVESSGPTILGSLSVEGDGLLALAPEEASNEQPSLLGLPSLDPNLNLPALLMQQLERSTQPVPLP